MKNKSEINLPEELFIFQSCNVLFNFWKSNPRTPLHHDLFFPLCIFSYQINFCILFILLIFMKLDLNVGARFGSTILNGVIQLFTSNKCPLNLLCLCCIGSVLKKIKDLAAIISIDLWKWVVTVGHDFIQINNNHIINIAWNCNLKFGNRLFNLKLGSFCFWLQIFVVFVYYVNLSEVPNTGG